MTKEQAGNIIRAMAADKNAYIRDCNARVSKEDGKIIGVEYMWQKLHDILATEVNSQDPKTGYWIGIDEEPHEDYECSCCGYVVSTFTANIEPHTEYKYCPHCGAKMESEDKE